MVATLEISDTTLRDGAQAAGAMTNSGGRRHWYEAASRLGIPLVEMGLQSTVADRQIPKDMAYCAEKGGNTRVVAFGSTSKKQRPASDPAMGLLANCKAPVACIFGKADVEHVRGQLNLTPEDNERRVEDSVNYLVSKGKEVHYDAEHFFDGFRKDPAYALRTLEAAARGGAKRLILCDTNGGTPPTSRWGKEGVADIVKKAREYLDSKHIKVPLGLHMHNDRGDALENTLTALNYLKDKQDIIQVQGTMNGKGERAGNLNLATLIGNLATGAMEGLTMKVDLPRLKSVADSSYIVLGLSLPDPDNRPFVGEVAFAHKGGVHSDALKKMGPGAYQFADPRDFGNESIIVLNSLGGGATVELVAESFGIKLDKRDKDTAEKIKELKRRLAWFERRGYRLGALKAEQYLLISEAFGDKRRFFEVTGSRGEVVDVGRKKYSESDLSIQIGHDSYRDLRSSSGGLVDAMYKSFVKTLGKSFPFVREIHLVDFDSKIAQIHGEESPMRSLVLLGRNGEISETVGVDPNIIISARKALEHGFRYHIKRYHELTKS